MKQLTVCGTAYEAGLETGRYYKAYLNKTIGKYEKALEDPELKKRVVSLCLKLKNEYPEIYDELSGKAEGSKTDLHALYLMHSPELLWKESGCTTVCMKDKDGDVLFSHNEDESTFTKSNSCLIRQENEDGWVMGYTSADRLIGSCFGFNSNGLLFASNFIKDHGLNLDNISRYIISRTLYDSLNITDLKKRIRKIKTASPFSFNVIDINRKKAYNFEKDINSLTITEIEDRYARANHFETKKEPVNKTPSSSFRALKAKEMINELKTENVTLEDLMEIMDYNSDDKDRSIMIKDKGRKTFKTVASISFSTKDCLIIIKDYLEGKQYTYSINK